MAVVDNGKPAVTHYKVLQAWKEYSYVECRLETGRTHQIRVHLTSVGLPLLGDIRYGSRDERCTAALWSYRLALRHPVTGETVDVSALPPEGYPWQLFGEIGR